MSSKQGDNRNRVRAAAVYSLLCALCIVFGYIESLIPTGLIAPGVKLGLSNSVAMLLLIKGDIKGAFAVNIIRIAISALLFGSPFSLIFSFCAGTVSTAVCALLIKTPLFSPTGVSAVGGICHNTVQTVIASFLVGKGVWFYFPVLLIAGLVTGMAIGYTGSLVGERIKKAF